MLLASYPENPMTLDILIGNQNVWCVSGSTRDIFTLVRQKLERDVSRPRFPLFHRFHNHQKIYKKKDFELFREEIFAIQREIATVPYPCASVYMGDIEIDYFPMILPDGVFREDSKRYAGVDEKGLFIAPITLKAEIYGQFRKKYFSEVTPEHKYFRDLIPSVAYVPLYQSRITRVARTFKGAGMVWKNTLNRFSSFASEAQQRKTYLQAV